MSLITASPGWQAIDFSLAQAAPGQTPRQFAIVAPEWFGEESPLDNVAAVRCASPEPHWLYVSYGLSELYDKQCADVETSGYGFELTLRLAAPVAECDPPEWPVRLLNVVARQVCGSGCGLTAHQVIEVFPNDRTPGIAIEHWPKSAAGFAVSQDGLLPPLNTPYGRVSFLQLIGLTADELELAQEWRVGGVLERLRNHSSAGILDPRRPSLLANAACAGDLRSRAAAEGSQQEIAFVKLAAWSCRQNQMRLTLGAAAVPDVCRALRGRLPHGRSFLLSGGRAGIAWEPAESDGWRLRNNELLVISLSQLTVRQMLATLSPKPGVYTWPSLRQFELEVVEE